MMKNGLIALAIGGALYLVTKKKGQRGKIVIPAGGAVAAFLLLQYKSNQELTASNPAALLPQAVPTTATPGILPSLIPLIPSIINPILQKPAITPTSPTTAGSNIELPGYQDPGLYAV
jgi:hypothetical protein